MPRTTGHADSRRTCWRSCARWRRLLCLCPVVCSHRRMILSWTRLPEPPLLGQLPLTTALAWSSCGAVARRRRHGGHGDIGELAARTGGSRGATYDNIRVLHCLGSAGKRRSGRRPEQTLASTKPTKATRRLGAMSQDQCSRTTPRSHRTHLLEARCFSLPTGPSQAPTCALVWLFITPARDTS